MISTGYIKKIQSSLSKDTKLFQHIPLSLIDLVICYVHDLFSNRSLFTWKISDHQMISKMLNAPIGSKFTSSPFTLCRVQCQFEIYPNGDKQISSGYFIIYLRILSLPKYVKDFSFGRIFHVIENRATASFSAFANVNMHDFWGKKCPLFELVQINPDTITIQVEFIINSLTISDLNILNDYPLEVINKDIDVDKSIQKEVNII